MKRNVGPEDIDRLERCSLRWMELYKPYDEKIKKAFKDFGMNNVALQKKYIQQFNKMISDVKVVQRGGETFVRCRIGGVQQIAKPISKEVRDGIMDSEDLIKSKCEVAERIFAEEVVARLRMAKDRGMKI